MTAREKRIAAEAAALWRELYQEDPPARADGAEMIERMLDRLPPVAYDRLNTPHLRRGAMSWPKRSGRAG